MASKLLFESDKLRDNAKWHSVNQVLDKFGEFWIHGQFCGERGFAIDCTINASDNGLQARIAEGFYDFWMIAE
jgi:hypothetical protein